MTLLYILTAFICGYLIGEGIGWKRAIEAVKLRRKKDEEMDDLLKDQIIA